MSGLPPDWTTAPLGTLLRELRNGVFVSRPGNENTGRPILRISAVRPMQLRDGDVRYVPKSADIVGAESFYLAEGDLLFTRYSGNPEYVGACARVRHHLPDMLYPDKLIRGRVIPGLVDPGYLEAMMSAPQTREVVRRLVKTTAGQVGISGASLRSISVPVAPYAEQLRITVAIEEQLSRLDAGEAAIQAAGRKLQALRLSALQEALELPSDTQFRRAGELFRWASGKRIDLTADASGAIPVFGGNGVTGYAAQPIEKEATIVIGRVGAHCGNVHLTEGPAWITDNAIYAKSYSDGILLPFAALVFRDARLRRRAAGSGQPFVNQKILNEIEIPCIPIGHQAGILARHREAEEAFSRTEGQLHMQTRRSERLRSSILSAAFSGKLASQEAST